VGKECILMSVLEFDRGKSKEKRDSGRDSIIELKRKSHTALVCMKNVAKSR
jgi:hypothetical protein